jgi:hypothetical protein
MSRVILDHSIVGQAGTTLSIRKDREFAACRICGAVFQSLLNTNAVSDEEYRSDPLITIAAGIETDEWRDNHNKKHPRREHIALAKSGRTFMPEAAQRLAPYGLVSLDQDDETVHANLTAPRAPFDDVESTLKHLVTVPREV